jgi:ribonuclease-3
MLTAERLDALQQALGHTFRDVELLRTALTHKSFVNEHPGLSESDNERLEFLGDAVLDLVVSHLLVQRFPDHAEGDLSKLRASVVSEPGLSAVARRLGLGECLRLGRGEELTGGRSKMSILADAYEAVVASVYLDGGLEAAFRAVESHFTEALAALARGEAAVDFKTRLQEYVQAEMHVVPRYRLVATTGPDHDKTFEVEVSVAGEVLARGVGKNKKEAEQRAAEIGMRTLEARRIGGVNA